MGPGAVELRNVSFMYSGRQGGVHLLRDFSLQVRPGEFVSLVGPSGCGKSTVFKLVAGLLEPTAGEIRLGGQPAADRRGRVALMPQRDLLLPWRTVMENAVLFLELRGVDRREARVRAGELLEVFGLTGFESALPAQLSGGMRQRVAFLRTAVAGGEVMLLDEPFGALDALTRMEMHEWLMRVWERLGTTVLFITHDVEEALLLSDRVVIMGPRGSFFAAEAAVELARPRSRRLLSDPGFAERKAQLMDVLLRGMEVAG